MIGVMETIGEAQKQRALLRGNLQAVRETIALGWCQGPEAETIEGFPCGPKDPRAVGWCLVGAFFRSLAFGSNAFENCWHRFLVPFVRRKYGCTPIGFNEHPGTTQKEVLAMLDEAIAEV